MPERRKPRGVEVNLRIEPGEYLRVRLNGKLLLEVAAGIPCTRDGLEKELVAARGLQFIPNILRGMLDSLRRIPNIEDHVNATPAAKQQQFARGLLDGLGGITVEHPYPRVPPIAPCGTPSYRAGYEYGKCLRGVVESIDDLRESTSATSNLDRVE